MVRAAPCFHRGQRRLSYVLTAPIWELSKVFKSSKLYTRQTFSPYITPSSCQRFKLQLNTVAAAGQHALAPTQILTGLGLLVHSNLSLTAWDVTVHPAHSPPLKPPTLASPTQVNHTYTGLRQCFRRGLGKETLHC